ncbi:hypothetical protein OIU84_020511 [Salix udensis]|uniref:Uncharacterized protein n=1 Tax=Salix udensis TaxID=889485 RepID=A0AAD6PH38_9ROSI|nr:hypothetical protein OIU84_020511 [Salix udensis]
MYTIKNNKTFLVANSFFDQIDSSFNIFYLKIVLVIESGLPMTFKRKQILSII